MFLYSGFPFDWSVKRMKWADYYDRFWDWAESTQISRISSLTDFTSSAEVAEIANEFCDDKVASR
ncbi:MAG: hypothetical protein Q4A54_13690, partial [Parabacteroides sp.]|nr:hypothetical protein [Parabacteroides sp.]